MVGAFSLALLGFLLGVRHAVDADHVVAVTAIVTRQPDVRRAGLIGALWGLGHTTTMLVVGGAIIVFRIAVSPRVGLALEFSVAVMLILIGMINLVRNSPNAAPPSPARPVVVGMIHGLAGSAAVALLVLSAVDDPRWAMAYLLLFGVGTVVGMVIVTALIALPARYAAQRVEWSRRWLTLGSGAVSLVFGILLALEITRGGLFAGVPSWTPR